MNPDEAWILFVAGMILGGVGMGALCLPLLWWAVRISRSPDPVVLKQEVRPQTEADYVDLFNHLFQGQVEVQMPDGTRCDILTHDLAIEVDFAPKWYEAVGQCLHYAGHTNRKPAMLLIVRKLNERKYADRALVVARQRGIVCLIFEDVR